MELNIQQFGGRGASSSYLVKEQKETTSYKIPDETLERFNGLENANYYLADISPENYLKITSSQETIKEIEQEVKDMGSLDTKKLDKGYMMLNVDLDTGKVTSHEGRHRMQLLKNAGYKKAEIIVMSNGYNKNMAHNINSLHLKHQVSNETFSTTLTDIKYLNKRK